MPRQHPDKTDQNQDAIEHASDEQGSSALQGTDVKSEDGGNDGPEQSEVKPAKWQGQLDKEKEKHDKKEVEVDEACDSQGQILRVNTRIIVNGEQRLVMKLTNKSVLSIPAEVTDANRNQSLEEVSLAHPLSEVTRY